MPVPLSLSLHLSPLCVRPRSQAGVAIIDFISDCCVMTPNGFVKAGELRAAYVGWCEENGERPLSAGKVADRILMLHEGKFIFDGTPEDIVRSEDPRVHCFVEGRCHDEDLESLKLKG